MKKPTICGSNNVYIPESGCSECEEFAYRIEQLERWIENNFLTEEEIIALTPIECATDCQDSRACYGKACCMLVGCGDEDTVCNATVCTATVHCS